MLTRSSFALGVLSIFAALPAYASEDYCSSMQELSQKVSTCPQNALFVQAAKMCMKKIESDIAFNQAALTLAMQKNAAAAADSQSARIQNSGDDLARLTATLNGLIANAHEVQAELKRYRKNLSWPGGMTTSVVEGLHLGSFLSGFSCYADTASGLFGSFLGVDQKIDELKSAMAAAGILQAKDAVSIQRLRQNDSLSATAKAGPQTVNVPSKQTTAEQSTITGRINPSSIAGASGSRSASSAAGLKAGSPSRAPSSQSRVAGPDKTADPLAGFRSGELPPAAGGNTVSGSSSTRGAGADTVGALIWHDPTDPEQRNLQLNLPRAAKDTGTTKLETMSVILSNGGKASASEVADALASTSSLKSLPEQGHATSEGSSQVSLETAALATATTLQASSSGLVATQADLFMAVSLRYRSTDLFRGAR